MFWQKLWDNQGKTATLSVAVCLGEKGYSLAAVQNNQTLVAVKHHAFNGDTKHLMDKNLIEDVEQLALIARDCQLILSPKQYQLILMDAPNVPDDEVQQALKWNLKGLSDYDLDDVAMDVFFMPSQHEKADKKAMVAVTALSELQKKCTVCEHAFLNVKKAGIAEVALRNVLHLIQEKKPLQSDTPVIMIGCCDEVYTLHIFHDAAFYLIRTLEPSVQSDEKPDAAVPDLLLELERSIEYCINKLNLKAPETLFLTPGLQWVKSIDKAIQEKFALEIQVIDLMAYLDIAPPLSLDEQAPVFYSIAGALQFNHQDE